MKLKDLTGQWNVQATLDSEYVTENLDAIVERIDSQVRAQGGTTYIQEGTLYAKGSNQFWMLPKLARVRTGRIEFRSKDFIFHFDGCSSYCDKPKANNLLPNGFTTTNSKGEQTTWIKTEGRIVC